MEKQGGKGKKKKWRGGRGREKVKRHFSAWAIHCEAQIHEAGDAS